MRDARLERLGLQVAPVDTIEQAGFEIAGGDLPPVAGQEKKDILVQEEMREIEVEDNRQEQGVG